jgi:hypothetical protein
VEFFKDSTSFKLNKRAMTVVIDTVFAGVTYTPLAQYSPMKVLYDGSTPQPFDYRCEWLHLFGSPWFIVNEVFPLQYLRRKPIDCFCFQTRSR